MNTDILRNLLVLAALLGGILVGGGVDRIVVGFPAWRAAAWAKYSRGADLGNGSIFYPVVAIGHTVLTITGRFNMTESRDVTEERVRSVAFETKFLMRFDDAG